MSGLGARFEVQAPRGHLEASGGEASGQVVVAVAGGDDGAAGPRTGSGDGGWMLVACRQS
eukprot:498605-Pleurochrysis_carterae.AAC.2